MLFHVEGNEIPITVARFSKWRRLTGCVAYVRRFIHNTKESSSNASRLSGPLGKQELQKAELDCFKIAQNGSFIDEIAELSKGKTTSRKSTIFKLSAYLDEEGLLRSNSRLSTMISLAPLFYPAIVIS